ncbi:MAG: hypothetical protein AB3N23_20150 [Paracoccaceae bacterium]
MQMFGVVLWSDQSAGKAVIWCEDHGDLAFYSEADCGTEVLLGAGDLVKFELSMERQFRYAHKPELVSDSFSSGLAEALLPTSQINEQTKDRDRMSAEILPFRPRAGRETMDIAVRQRG